MVQFRYGLEWVYFVRSIDGVDYRVGTWREGAYWPGTIDDAMRELHALDEPGAYVWGRGERLAYGFAAVA